MDHRHDSQTGRECTTVYTYLKSSTLAITHTCQHSKHKFDISIIFLTDIIKLIIGIFHCRCCCCCWLLILILCYLHTTSFHRCNKKAALLQRCALYMSASHVSSQSRTRVKLNSVFPTPVLVSPKFLHVP